MAKLRKMLGKIDEPAVVQLMELIETQSKETLARWAVNEVKENALPLLQKAEMDTEVQQQAIAAVEEYLLGKVSLAKIKPQLKAASQAAATITDCPVGQAAARAVAVACAVAQTPTNALGFLFDSAAAAAYMQLGLDRTQQEYDQAATEELFRALESLRACAIPGEPNPVKINWHC